MRIQSAKQLYHTLSVSVRVRVRAHVRFRVHVHVRVRVWVRAVGRRSVGRSGNIMRLRRVGEGPSLP